MVKYIAFIFFFLLLLKQQYAHTWLDSLKADTELHDTPKLEEIVLKGKSFLRTDQDSALFYFSEAILFADQSKDKSKAKKALRASAFRFKGVTHRQLGNTDQALVFYEKALQDYKSIHSSAGMALIYRNIGNVHFYQSDYPLAIKYYDNALQNFEKAGDKNGMASIYNNLGSIYENQAKYDRAIKKYLEALKIFEALDNKQYQSVAYTNIGVIHYRQGDFEKGISYLEKSLRLKEETNDKRGSGIVLMNLSSFYIGLAEQQGSHEDQQKYYQKAVDLLKKSLQIRKDLEDVYGISLCYNSLGEIYSRAGDYTTALNYLRKSLQISQSIGNKRGEVFSLHNMSKMLYEQSRYRESIIKGETALEIAEEIESVLDQKQVLFYLVKNHNALNQGNMANEYFNRYETVSSAYFDESKAQSVIEIKTRYQTEKKQQEIELLNQAKALNEIKLQNARKERVYFAIISFSFLALSVMLYYLYAGRKKTNALLATKNDELNKLISTKDKFISILAHDLKNPFAAFVSISSSLHLDYDKISDTDKKKFLGKINKSAHQLNSYLKNLLDWAVVQKNTTDVEMQILELHEVVEEVKDSLSGFAEELGLKVENKVPENTKVFANKSYLVAILNNLISNALKFSDKEKPIQVGVRFLNGHTEVNILDYGVGIAPGDIPKLFRIDVNTKSIYAPKGKGSGMGLILCKELVERLNGKIEAESEPGKGSKFIFTLPSVEA